MDRMYDKHRAIAQEQYQPDTYYHMQNFHEQWMRPVEEQARWNMSIIKEQSEMVLIDLMNISRNQTVVADVYFKNIIKGLELTNDLEQQMMRESGLRIIERKQNETKESLLKELEAHFGLSK